MDAVIANITWDFILISRRIRNFGIHPVLGFLLLILLVVVLPAILLERQKYFAPTYFCAGVLSLIPLNKKERCDFLRNCHTKRNYYLTRCVENLIVTLPYMIIFMVHHKCLYVLALLVFAVLTLFLSLKKISIVIPTPLLKSSFEFVLGFRYSFILIFGLYFMCFEAAIYQNLALGVASLLLLFVIFIGYFFYAEPDYYVWIYKSSSKDFLSEKMINVARNALILTILPILLLSFSFHPDILVVLYFFLHGFCCLMCSIVLKYYVYPAPMNIGEEILLVLTIICPLLPLVLCFALWKKTVKKLSEYL